MPLTFDTVSLTGHLSAASSVAAGLCSKQAQSSGSMISGFTRLPETDLGGNLRIVDGNDDGEAIVDMGAYEYQAGES